MKGQLLKLACEKCLAHDEHKIYIKLTSGRVFCSTCYEDYEHEMRKPK